MLFYSSRYNKKIASMILKAKKQVFNAPVDIQSLETNNVVLENHLAQLDYSIYQ